jgi:plasmid stability protein
MIRLPEDLYTDLRAYAAAHAIPMARIIREALQEYVEEATERIRSGVRLDTPRQHRSSTRLVPCANLGIDEELYHTLRVLVALDRTTVRYVVQRQLRKKVGGFAGRALESLLSGSPMLKS